MTKKIRCPDCNSPDIGLLYCTTETILYCRKTAHEGLNAYKTTRRDAKDFGKEWEKVRWDYKCPDELEEES